jgi:hypothetical protein
MKARGVRYAFLACRLQAMESSWIVNDKLKAYRTSEPISAVRRWGRLR